MDKTILVSRWPVGGIRTYIKYVYSCDYFNNSEFLFVTTDESVVSFVDSALNGKLKKTIVIPNKVINIFFKSFKLLYKSRPTMVHSHGLTSGLLFSIPCYLMGIKHIVTLHDVFSDALFGGYKGKIKKLVIEQLLRKTTVINPCGFDAAENFKKFFPKIPAQKVHPIRNGVEPSLFINRSARDLRSELKLDRSKILLGFYGRFMAQKGFDLIVKALDGGLKKKDIHIVCFGWGGFIREEQENIRKLGLEDMFSFMPHTDKMGEAIRGVDLVLMPSRWEACPLLPMEVMISGVPIVTSDCIGMKEVCSDSPTLMFEAGSVSQLANKLNEAIENIEELSIQANKFTNTAIERFDVRNTQVALSELYDQVKNGELF